MIRQMEKTMNIKKSIRKLLAERDMTQAALAKKAAIREETLSRMIKGNDANTKVLRKICFALDVSMWEFMKEGSE